MLHVINSIDWAARAVATCGGGAHEVSVLLSSLRVELQTERTTKE